MLDNLYTLRPALFSSYFSLSLIHACWHLLYTNKSYRLAIEFYIDLQNIYVVLSAATPVLNSVLNVYCNEIHFFGDNIVSKTEAFANLSETSQKFSK